MVEILNSTLSIPVQIFLKKPPPRGSWTEQQKHKHIHVLQELEWKNSTHQPFA